MVRLNLTNYYADSSAGICIKEIIGESWVFRSINIMFIYVILLFIFFPKTIDSFIIESYSPTCRIGKLTFLRKTWEVSDDVYNVIFDVCDLINTSKCGSNKKMCLTSTSNGKFSVSGNEFESGTNGDLVLNTKNTCNITIKLICADTVIEKPRLQKIGKEGCQFEIFMMTVDCRPRCMINHGGHLINLRSLGNTVYHVESGNRNFSIGFCGSNQDCRSTGVSSCEITDPNKIIPLSSYDDENWIFRDDLNEIYLHGKFTEKLSSVKRRFEIQLKCNWTLSVPHIIHLDPGTTQGKNYKFQMESKEGCIKIPPNCVGFDKYYVYNLTDLYRKNGFWEVEQTPGEKKMVLNVCGLLNPAFSTVNNHCSSSSSQVCDIFKDKYTNRGSFHHNLSVGKKISISLTGGDPCEYAPTKQLETNIEFECSKLQENPMFIKEDQCVTHLNWKTPLACPKINKSKCIDKHPDIHYNCTLDSVEKVYNLSSLFKKNQKYVVNDSKENIQYLMNVCGSIHDDEVPCIKNSMVVLKNLTEINVIHKFKSYGEFRTITENDKGQLVIETYGGTNCGYEGNITYCRSTVFFECSKREEHPVILKKTNVSVEFLWKTPVACPKLRDSCIFQNPFNNYTIDFTRIQKTELEVTLNGNSTYFFDLCENDRSKCEAIDCKYISFNKTIVTHEDTSYLEVSLDEPCNSSQNQFNKSIFELICDKITNNDHFEFKNIDNCILTFQFKSRIACVEDEPVIEINEKYERKSDKTKYNIQKFRVENGSEGIKVNDVSHHETIRELKCFVINPNTGYQFNISSLKLNLTTPECPRIVFNESKKYVSLVFESEKTCKTGDAPNEYPYIITLHCPSGSQVEAIKTEMPENSGCNIEFSRPEACMLFDETILTPQKLNAVSVAGIVISVLVTIGVTLFVLWKWKVRYTMRSMYDTMSYNKDGDL